MMTPEIAHMCFLLRGRQRVGWHAIQERFALQACAVGQEEQGRARVHNMQNSY